MIRLAFALCLMFATSMAMNVTLSFPSSINSLNDYVTYLYWNITSSAVDQKTCNILNSMQPGCCLDNNNVICALSLNKYPAFIANQVMTLQLRSSSSKNWLFSLQTTYSNYQYGVYFFATDGYTIQTDSSSSYHYQIVQSYRTPNVFNIWNWYYGFSIGITLTG